MRKSRRARRCCWSTRCWPPERRLALAYQALVEKAGRPRRTILAAAIASEEGLEYAKKHFSAQDTSIWCGTVDSELTVKSYIVPGLGDAGDLAYGDKM